MLSPLFLLLSFVNNTTFEEINDFYEKNNREPQKTTDMNERGLFSRLKGLRANPQKIQALEKYDRFKLLEEV